MAGGQIQLVGLTKRFGGVTAVDGIDLSVAPGEFFSLLGPSGCGKTTTLRLLAGFEEPTAGRVALDGVDVTHTPPHKRNVNTVFQSYALFPFLSVHDNVAFGLQHRRLPKAEVRRRVAEALALVHLDGMADRRPGQLSGGQQQRVALARALVLEPSVLLLDEPLGALDAKLRRSLKVELKALQERVGVTFLYVTHDQEEALTMSDRLAVMRGGRIAQVGPPREVYEQPVDSYVADFLGVSNLMTADVVELLPDGCRLIAVGRPLTAVHGPRTLGAAQACVRPERIRLEPFGSDGPNRLPALVDRVVYLGSTTQVILRLPDGTPLQALRVGTGEAGDPGALDGIEPGSPVHAYLPPDAVRVLTDRATIPPAAEPADGRPAVPAQG